MNNDEIKRTLSVSYYSEKETKLTLQLKNNEQVRVQRIELLNNAMVLVTLDAGVSRIIYLHEIEQATREN